MLQLRRRRWHGLHHLAGRSGSISRSVQSRTGRGHRLDGRVAGGRCVDFGRCWRRSAGPPSVWNQHTSAQFTDGTRTDRIGDGRDGDPRRRADRTDVDRLRSVRKLTNEWRTFKAFARLLAVHRVAAGLFPVASIDGGAGHRRARHHRRFRPITDTSGASVLLLMVSIGHAHHAVRERFTVLPCVVRNIFGSDRWLLLQRRCRILRNRTGRHFHRFRANAALRSRISPPNGIALVDVSRIGFPASWMRWRGNRTIGRIPTGRQIEFHLRWFKKINEYVHLLCKIVSYDTIMATSRYIFFLNDIDPNLFDGGP